MMIEQASGLEVPTPELAEINNFRQYTPVFASAGQPSREQLRSLWAEDFERIVYLAFSTNPGAITDEDKLVKDLGMD